MLAWTVRAPISWRPREEARPTGRTPPRPGPAPEARRTRCAEFLIEEFFPLGLVRKEKGGGGEDLGSASREPGNPEANPQTRELPPGKGTWCQPPAGPPLALGTPAARNPSGQAPAASAPRPRGVAPCRGVPRDARDVGSAQGAPVRAPIPQGACLPSPQPRQVRRAALGPRQPLSSHGHPERPPAPQVTAGGPTYLARAPGCAAVRPPPPARSVRPQPPQPFVSARAAHRAC